MKISFGVYKNKNVYLVLLDKVDMEYEFIREFCFPGFTVSTEVTEMFDPRIKLGKVSGQM